ncbi:hypothetical protein V1477_019467, partial [Vespula maculifrons]
KLRVILKRSNKANLRLTTYRETTGIVYEVKLAIYRNLVAKWTVISMNSGETLHREINNELSNKNTANFILQYVNEKSPIRDSCGTEKVPLAIKQFSIEYRPDTENNGLIIDKKLIVFAVYFRMTN